MATVAGGCGDVDQFDGSPSTQRPARLREVTVPGWWRWAPQATVLWAVGYGSLRVYWALGQAPSPPPVGTDLIVFTGWWPVVLCVAAAAAALALRAAPWSRPLAVGAWCVAGALVAASAVLLLDVVGILLPGVGVTVDAPAFLSRVACLAGGVLVGATTLSYQRHWRGACLACGRTGEVLASARETGPPRWAWLAAWVAVAGCLVRLLAQLAVGFGSHLLGGMSRCCCSRPASCLPGRCCRWRWSTRGGACFLAGCPCWRAGVCLAGWCWVPGWCSGWG